MNARERVNRGIALLDRVNPGWDEKIRLDMFDIANSDYCILGQVYMTYGMGTAKLGLFTNEARYHGFDASSTIDGVTFEALQKAWVEAMEERAALKEAQAVVKAMVAQAEEEAKIVPIKKLVTV